MIKQDLTYFKKQFNREKGNIRIKDVYSVFINGDTRKVCGTEYQLFNMLEEKKQDLYIENMKKIFTGKIDVKVFEKKFDKKLLEKNNVNIKNLFDKCIDGDKKTFVETSNQIIDKILNLYAFENNIGINFYRLILFKKDTQFKFILCTINNEKNTKPEIIFDFTNNNFVMQTLIDPILQLDKPAEGFMYPLYECQQFDTGKVLYYSSKSNKINSIFVRNILNCVLNLTAKQEQIAFSQILHALIGEKIKPVDLQNIYDCLLSYLGEDKNDKYGNTISPKLLLDTLESLDFEIKNNISDVYQNILGKEKYDFKAINVIPNYSEKSISIINEDAEIKIAPNYLENIKQVQDDNGNMYLLVRLTENLTTNGFNITSEQIDNIKD